MPTRPIGPGTANLCANMPLSLHRYVGRFAFAVDLSMGDVVRRVVARLTVVWMAARGLEQAAEADTKALTLLRNAAADGIGPEDTPAIKEAIALVEQSEREDRQWAAAIKIST